MIPDLKNILFLFLTLQSSLIEMVVRRTYDYARTYRCDGARNYDGARVYRPDGARTYDGSRIYSSDEALTYDGASRLPIHWGSHLQV